MTDRSQFVFTSAKVPTKYDELLVPRLFLPWAEALVRRLRPKVAGRMLDVATGPGTVARVLSRVVGSRGLVAACDSSPAMIARAESKGEVPDGAPIAYTVAPAAPLPYPDASFDAVTCQQGLQFFPDAQAALGEMVRVLGPKGRMAASVWHSQVDCSVFYAYTETLFGAGCDDLARLLTVPFPHWNGTELADRARTAGFRTVDVVTETIDLVFPEGIDQALDALAGSPIGPMLESLDPEVRQRIRAEAERRFAPLLIGGAVRGPMSSWVLVAKA